MAIVLLAVAVLSGCTLWKAKPVTSWSQATGGEHLERLFWRELKARNYAALERRMSATFVAMDGRGVYDRSAALEMFKEMRVEDYILGDFEIRPSGTDMVVTYTARVNGGHPMRMMSVWQQAKDGWITTAHAEAMIE
ncbi:MAG: nuclear transport factor 2 family protein [Terriglobales bacterium]